MIFNSRKNKGRFGLNASATSIALGLVFMGTPATAEVVASSAPQATESSGAPADSADQNEGADIVVTGSRIARRGYDTAAPVAVIGQEEFKLSGAINVESVLNKLPQVVPGITAFSNNPGGGVATLNLRNLGSTRTLVLVNGRRYMFFDTSQRVDLNVIPSFLLQDVDVVTGGASAVYGSDAIAGVVNFRLRNDLVGVEAGGQYSITGEGDGARYDAYLALGTDFADGRGHITAYGEYFRRKSIYQDARGFSRVALADNDAADALVFGGNATVPQGRITVPGTVTVGTGPNAPIFNLGRGTNYCSGTLATCPGGSAQGAFFGNAGVSTPYQGNAIDGYNIDPANLLQVPQERYLLGAYGEYKVSDHVTAYMEVSFANNRVENQLAATPVTGAFNVTIANIAQYLSASDVSQLNQIDANETAINAARAANNQTSLFGPLVANGANASLPGVVQLSVNRRILETGGRVNKDERNSFRILTGLKGEITDSINYDVYYSYARTRNANVQYGNISRSGFTTALNAGDLNIFGLNSITPSQLSAIAITAQNNDISVLQVASASVSGNLFNLGLGGDDVGFAVGGEYRKMGSEFIPDTALSSGDVIGFNAGDPTSGHYNVKEVFGELRIPIVADRPFFDRLELNGAARYSDYSLDAVGGVYTYAGGIQWAPIKDITFRGQYQRAVRAPNVGELFGGQSQGFPTATDPCGVATAAADAAVNATCIATGVPAGLVGSAGLRAYTQIQGVFGGNPDLQEEKSDSYTFGAVLRPRFIPRLSISADYFHVKVENAIATAGGGVNNILNLCYNTIQDASSAICQLIQRDPNSGEINGAINANSQSGFNVVTATNANIASLKTSGIDVKVDYVQPLNFGLFGERSRLNFSFLGTWTEKDDTQPITGLDTVVKCAGLFGATCGNPHPKYKGATRISWIDGIMTTSFAWRYLSSVRDDDEDTVYVVEKLKAYSLFDLAFSADITDNYSLSLGVNNIFNKKPPIIGDNQEQANTYPGVYDVLGRDFFVSAKLRF